MSLRYLSISILLAIFFSSCSSFSHPKREIRSPVDFLIPDNIWNRQGEKKGTFRFLVINSNPVFRQKVLKSWQEGLFFDRFQQVHPLLEIHEDDVNSLHFTLNELKLIYVSTESARKISTNLLRDTLRETMHCEIMSKYELLYFTGDIAGNIFSEKKLTLLEISAQQLMMLNGLRPVYAKVVSNYFKKFTQFKTKALGIINLPQDIDRIKPRQLRGFIFCRPESRFYPSIPI